MFVPPGYRVKPMTHVVLGTSKENQLGSRQKKASWGRNSNSLSTYERFQKNQSEDLCIRIKKY